MKQIQRQQLQQKLSPQQIQLMRLLQLPVTDLEQAIKEEVEKNPLLEAEAPETEDIDTSVIENNTSDWDENNEDDNDYDYRENLENDPNTVHREFVVTDTLSFAERLAAQLITRDLTDRQRHIAIELIGTLDDAGYLSRDLDLVTNDMAFRQGIDASRDEVEAVLRIIQTLDPAGIGARNLQECLLLQLQRMDKTDLIVRNAHEVLEHYFDDFANHRYAYIAEELGLDSQGFDEVASLIRRLNPKPGSSDAEGGTENDVITPDIIITRHDEELQFYVNDGTLPRLSLNSYYVDMLSELEQTKGDRTTIQFLRSKQGDAQEFIDLLRQRHDTITRVMRYIIKHQHRYLLTGNPDLLQPMRQREVAEATGLDISTVSRMANSKYLQTDFGTIPLKDCFSKGMTTDDGEEVSVETIKQRLADAINAENKQAPLSDEALTALLNQQGFPLARRTVAKYREQLGFPVARLRRVIIILLIFIGFNASAQMSYYDSIMTRRYNKALQTEAAAIDKPGESKSHHNKTTSAKPATTKERRTRPSADNTTASAVSTLSDALAPMWYTDFPHHRVNPMGRTTLALLPDEINIKLVNSPEEFCFPVKNPKTSTYGWRWHRGHHGVDIRLRTGDPVHAAFGGVVRVASRMGGYGNCVVIRHPNGLETLYGHLSKINVRLNQEVAAGDIVGLGGSTGNSTGPHLHFECRFLYQTFDPEWILDFSNYSLRTRRLHLDKSYFGIRQPKKGQQLDYKADQSIIKEPLKKRKKTANTPLNLKDF